MKRFLAVLAVAALGTTLGGDAFAKQGSGGNGGKSANKRAYQFWGTVTDADGDDDPATAGPFVIEATKANGNAKRYFRTTPGPVTVTVSESTRFNGAASSAADIADGDSVKVKARNTEIGFAASKVKERS